MAVSYIVSAAEASVASRCAFQQAEDKIFLTKSCNGISLLDTIQDFLCKLGMKPHIHLVEISIFSLNHVIVRPTEIIKDLCKACT